MTSAGLQFPLHFDIPEVQRSGIGLSALLPTCVEGAFMVEFSLKHPQRPARRVFDQFNIHQSFHLSSSGEFCKGLAADYSARGACSGFLIRSHCSAIYSSGLNSVSGTVLALSLWMQTSECVRSRPIPDGVTCGLSCQDQRHISLW
jgi:hypothetical protein